MPRFDYLVRTSGGESLEGVINAPSASDAARRLRADGKFVVRIMEAAEAVDAATAQITFGGKRIKGDDIIIFATQMAVMMDTGVGLTEALTSIIEQSESQGFKTVLTKVLADVEAGTPLSTAMAKHPKAFKPLIVNLVRASESSGKMGLMFDRAAGYLTAQRETRKKVVGALIYPAFLMLMSINVVIFLLTYLMPKFSGIYKGREQMLPVPTKILMGVSNWLATHWMWWGSATLVLLVGGIFFFRSATGRRPLHWIMLRIPLIGSMMRKSFLSRSLRTLGTLIESGVAMLDAVGITRSVVGNVYYQDMWDRVDDRVQQGEQLSAPLIDTSLVPRAVTQMIRAGETSGKLPDVLDRISTFFERDLDQAVKRVTQMIEPIMIFVMGGIVGSIVIALLLPIFTISRVMNH
ncbi:MAG TPA: type II secretion system F family protein [Phycisphaerae bacterium]|nr:type II secretion system F family protein [Phycisphaerae bacterium]